MSVTKAFLWNAFFLQATILIVSNNRTTFKNDIGRPRQEVEFIKRHHCSMLNQGFMTDGENVTLYTLEVLTVSDEQREFLTLDGPPLPLVDAEEGRCYMLMPVTFDRDRNGRIMARVPGIRAIGEADQPVEALATLAILIKDVLDRL